MTRFWTNHHQVQAESTNWKAKYIKRVCKKLNVKETRKLDNPEKLVAFGTQDTGQRQTYNKTG